MRWSMLACLTILAASCGGMACGDMHAAADPTSERPAGDVPGSNQQPGGDQASLGGQSGGASGADDVPACYCGFSELAKARVVSGGADGECAVFELVEKPASDDHYHGLALGDRFGGSARALCEDGFDIAAETLVYVRYWPGDQATMGCTEYQACSQSQCGDPPQPNSNAEVESPTYLEDLAVWDACDGHCVEQTRDVCATYTELAHYSGKLTVAPMGEDETVMFTFNQTYSVKPQDIAESTCTPAGVPRKLVVTESGDSPGGEVAAAPPPQEPSELTPVVCSVPDR